jgi:molybdate transport system substrate-binding protein
VRVRVALVLVLAIVVAACSGGNDDGSSSVRVLAAASLTDVFGDLGDAFTADHPDVELQFDFGPSSGLAAQIREGAPADVFASADETAMADATDHDATPFAANALQLAVPAGNPAGITGLADLADPDLLVGLCAEEVPCGRAAQAVLERAGVTASVDTFEPDVRSLLTKLEAGELDAGIVYRTDVLAAGGEVEAVDARGADAVVSVYPIVALSDGAAAGDFVAFVLSDEGQAVLAAAGFLPAP